MQTNQPAIDIRPAAGALGAEIHGVDLSNELSEAAFAAIRQALDEHGVIVFRDQQLTPGQHVGFAQRWGPINVNRFFQAVEGWPMIAQVLKEPHQRENIGSGWHTDHTYDRAPAMGSVLYAREVPEFGGDTIFASMYAAWAGLSDGLKQTLAGLRARHSSRHVFGESRADTETGRDGRIGNRHLATQDAVHAVTPAHPRTGRRVLYVNPGFTTGIEGWTEAEARPLLDYLYRQASRPENTFRLRWRPGTLAVWDNLSTWHMAVNDYQGQRRLMHRITIDGVPLEEETRAAA